MQIEFVESNPPTDITRIHEFQQAWGITLPPYYRDFLLKNNGGRPVQTIFFITGFIDPFGGIQVFFGLGTPAKTSDLNWRIKNRIAPFPDGLLEIACTDGNDLVCINTKLADVPVFFYDHRPAWGNGVWRDENLYAVANSFEDFLSELKK